MRRNTERPRRTFDVAGDEAIISPCRRYRYWLARLIKPTTGKPKVVSFIMVNPSTADAHEDDPTIRSCKRIALRNGATHMVVVNLYAARSTEVKKLARMRDPVGLTNDFYLRRSLKADVVIVAWGSRKKMPPCAMTRVSRLCMFADERDVMLQCLGTTKHGDPRHPLFIRSDTPLERWDAFMLRSLKRSGAR